MHGLEGYAITKQVEDDEGIHLTAKIPGKPADCDKCGGKWNSNGTRSVLIRDVNIGTKMVGVEVIRQRYICRVCRQCAIQTMPHIHEGHLMTTRLVDFIKSESTQYPFLVVANKIGMDEGTVSAIHQESVELRIAEMGISTPRYMGLDEIHLGDTDMAVITNLEASTVYDIRPGRTAEELGRFFKELPDREKVEAIVIDDWKAYRTLIRKWFSCPIVVDKAHLIFRAGHAMEAARKAVRSELKRTELRRMKSDRSLLPKREFEEDWQKEALAKMLADFPVLAECRAALVGFWQFWNVSTAQTAETNLTDWKNSVGDLAKPYFRQLMRITEDWSQEILNYFFLPTKLTNAKTERWNDSIRDLAKAGRGYSFATLRQKVLLNLGVAKVERRYTHASRRGASAPLMGFSMDYSFSSQGEEVIEKLGADLELLLADLRAGNNSRGDSEILVDMVAGKTRKSSVTPDLFG